MYKLIDTILSVVCPTILLVLGFSVFICSPEYKQPTKSNANANTQQEYERYIKGEK